jgi:SnoaL-like domain
VDEIESLKQLKARYFRLMDTQDWDALAQLFTDDVTIDVSDDGAGVRVGVAEHMTKLRRLLAGAVSCHHGHTPEIEITSSSTARGIWAMEDRIWWPVGRTPQFLHGFGHYHETYVKVDGEWRIRTLTLTRLHRELS